jgi:RES domain-containing protein
MVYLASSRSLAILEALAHLSPTNIPDGFCMMIIDAPDDFAHVDIATLPENWHEFPEPMALKRIGNNFLAENRSLLLKVPSAIVNDEFNYVLNPMHANATAVKIVSSKPFHFDSRLV